ncbi:MAG: glycosyltransferase family 9 protein [Candidatus Omnitrophota bacterium]
MMGNKILVIKLGALGDMVLASAAFASLRQSFPKSELALLTTPIYLPLVKDCPYFTEVFLFRREENFFLQASQTGVTLRRKRFSTVVNLQNNFKANLLAYLTGAPERIGFRKGPLPNLLTKSLLYNPEENALWNINQVLALAGAFPAERMELYITPEKETETEDLLKSSGWSGQPLAGLHPGASSGWQSKRWPDQYWVDLARKLSEKGIIPVFFGDSSEYRKLEEISKEVSGKTFNLAGKALLSLLPAIIKKCRVFISTDSGPLFIAAAGGIKTLGLYGPTESRRHAPPGVTVLETAGLACRPCYRKFCSKPVCLTNITPEEVLKVCL